MPPSQEIESAYAGEEKRLNDTRMIRNIGFIDDTFLEIHLQGPVLAMFSGMLLPYGIDTGNTNWLNVTGTGPSESLSHLFPLSPE
jgi:hypothetical protein